MDVVRVVVVNRSCLPDDDVVDGVAALQKQVSDDFQPEWRVDAALTAVGRNVMQAYAAHWAVILIDENQPAAQDRPPWEGYGDLTREGLPLARVYVNRVPKGQDWTHATSRALLNMLVDPHCSAVAYDHPDAGTRHFYAVDVCDPVATYDDGYSCGNRQVADFTYRAYWDPQAGSGTPGTRFDERRLVRAPFEVRKGGTIGVYDFATSSWRALDDDGTVEEMPEVGSRLEQRATARDRWKLSVARWVRPNPGRFESISLDQPGESISPP